MKLYVSSKSHKGSRSAEGLLSVKRDFGSHSSDHFYISGEKPTKCHTHKSKKTNKQTKIKCLLNIYAPHIVKFKKAMHLHYPFDSAQPITFSNAYPSYPCILEIIQIIYI
jgi:hypothetical protein